MDDNSGENQASGNRIIVGGIESDEMSVEVTKAASYDAETIDWLLQPLKNGLDITYGLYDSPVSHESVAILKLVDSDGEGGEPYDKDGNVAVYSFKYRNEPEVDAKWYNNGPHYFQGVYVPDRIRYNSDPAEVDGPAGKAPGLITDQHDGRTTGTDDQLGNYTLLSHYLGMPADFKLTATIERIKLPFRHRLARVIAFVLIDPLMNTSLKGYYTKDGEGHTIVNPDQTQTGIIFSNVGVLQGVRDVTDGSDHHILTPSWTNARTVIPHFEGEKGSYNYSTQTEADTEFKVYYKEDEAKSSILFPTSTGWKAVHDAADHKGYIEVNYGTVPVYDVIVRPTYTDVDHVMYDEEITSTKTKQWYANQKNQIKFELDLENGLSYAKTFNFDLNANYQTVVYLQISREHVDYNSTGAELWITSEHNDDWYGVDNDNGNTLSKAGSSWQRAYRSTTISDDKVTDGDFYNSTDESVGQYLGTAAKWTEHLLAAYEGGDHHGDYFILDNNITIDATLIPKDFVFTGHLDAQDHTITLNNVGEDVYKSAETLESLFTKSGGVYSGWTIPALYVKLETPVYYDASELEIVDGISYVRETLTFVPERTIYYETQAEVDEENAKHLVDYVIPAEYYSAEEAEEWNAEHEAEIEAGTVTAKQEGDLKKPEQVIRPGEYGYVKTYEDGYEEKHIGDVKEVIPSHYETNSSSVKATVDTVKRIDVTYPLATESTVPAYPATLEALKTNEYYTDDHSGTRFVCPELYQFSHVSPAYLFSGLNGTYTTAQENAANPYAKDSEGNLLVTWEANVHKETNKSTVWVPTTGYRAEVLNLIMADPATLFKADAVISGNVQNCYNGETAIPNNTPDIPRYK